MTSPHVGASRLIRYGFGLSCVIALVCGLAGCIPAERAAASESLQSELRTLPAVETAVVSNPVRSSAYRMLEVRVRIGDNAKADDLGAIQQVYARRVAGRASDGQSVAPLLIQWCDARSARQGELCSCPDQSASAPIQGAGSCSSLRSAAGVSVPNDDWLRLRHTETIDQVQIAVSKEKRTVEVVSTPPAGDLARTVRTVRQLVPNLAESGWMVRSILSSIEDPVRIPDDAALAVWEQLRAASAATITRFRILQSPAPTEPDLIAVDMHALTIDQARIQAIRHLSVLQRQNRPVTYRARITGDATVELLVNGCTRHAAGTDGAPPPTLQKELRDQYERC